MRLVVVSNRVALPQKGAQPGGMAVALNDTLKSDGGIWFGWGGDFAPHDSASSVQVQRAEGVTYITVSLTKQLFDQYYAGYSNSVLWPLCHSRTDLVEYGSRDIDGYRKTNKLFAQCLNPFIQEDDIIWIHDYHLIPLAAELRSWGIQNRIGFFLHIPVPPPQLFQTLPDHEVIARTLAAYDLIGLQTERDCRNLIEYFEMQFGAVELSATRISVFGKTLAIQAFPIGIDVEAFQKATETTPPDHSVERFKKLASRHGMLIGVDRLDYSKGLPQKFRAFEHFLSDPANLAGRAVLTQIAPLSRADIDAYASLREELEQITGRILGSYGDLDWTPLFYLNRGYSRECLAHFFRMSDAALVTPLADGMNLVAKEFIAAQDPGDPGVLILSRFAGAAEQMESALLVNPYDEREIAEAIGEALVMPVSERRNRYSDLMEVVRKTDVRKWAKDYLATLRSPGNPRIHLVQPEGSNSSGRVA